MILFGLRIVKKVDFGIPTRRYKLNDVKSINFTGYGSGGCIETTYWPCLKSITAHALAGAGSMVHLNYKNIDLAKDYGISKKMIAKLLTIPYEEFTKLFEYAGDLKDIAEYGRITTTFRVRRKYLPLPKFRKYILEEDLPKFKYLRDNEKLINY